MAVKRTKSNLKKIRHYRIRKDIIGTSERPRLSVYRSNKHIYLQVIDDSKGITLAFSSTKNLKLESNNIDNSILVAKELAKILNQKNIKQLVFDRGGNLYHGKVKSIADTLREEGIKI